MSPDLSKKLQQLTENANVRDIRSQLAGAVTETELSRVTEGLNKLPLSKVFDHLKYLDEQILPRIEKRDGIDSAQYKHFKGIFDALLWAVNSFLLIDRYQYQLSNQVLQVEFYREKCLFYERELQRYTTMEDLTMRETFNDLKETMAVAGVRNLQHSFGKKQTNIPKEDEI